MPYDPTEMEATGIQYSTNTFETKHADRETNTASSFCALFMYFGQMTHKIITELIPMRVIWMRTLLN
jgi:hypothetical protein